MKIGIFGDSYAEKKSTPKAWWRKLESDHGHTVVSHGTGASSILYSANLLKKHHQEYDFNIWCLTTPGRVSLSIPGTEDFFHSAWLMDASGTYNGRKCDVDQTLITACHQYLKYIFDFDSGNLSGKALAHYFLNQMSNLMIIPCFFNPLESEFNLYRLCEKEILSVFPNKETEVYKIYQYYNDIRACHLTEKNNSILAELVDSDLSHGVFTTDYSNFCFDDININDILIPR